MRGVLVMPDIIKIEFHLFNPAWVQAETANGVSHLAKIYDMDPLRLLLERFEASLTLEWLEQPARPDDVYRGALLAIRDMRKVVGEAVEFAIVREAQEKAKDVEHKKWRMP